MTKKKIPTLSDIVSGEVAVAVETPARAEEHPVQAAQPAVASNAAAPHYYATTAPQARPLSFKPVAPLKVDDKKNRASTTVYLPPRVKRQLEELWFAERHKKSQNDLFLEGLDLVFRSRGLPSIEELTEGDS